jgi:hypothetical protein
VVVEVGGVVVVAGVGLDAVVVGLEGPVGPPGPGSNRRSVKATV